MANRRQTKSVTLKASPETSEVPAARRGTKKSHEAARASQSTDAESAVDGDARALFVRKWVMRLTGVGLIALSVLLVHFQGGG